MFTNLSLTPSELSQNDQIYLADAAPSWQAATTKRSNLATFYFSLSLENFGYLYQA